MVVDNVENDLDAGVMQRDDGRSEGVERRARRITRLGREEAQRIVAPVVAQAALDQVPVVDEGVDRQQLDSGDAQPLEMIDRRRAQPSPRNVPRQRGRHILAQLRQAFDVGFVDDRVFPRDARACVPRPR